MDGAEIRALRLGLGLSQEAFAERIGVAQATVCRLENGQPPSKPVLKILEGIKSAGARIRRRSVGASAAASASA